MSDVIMQYDHEGRGTAGDNSDTENENDGEETTEEGNRAAVQEN